MLKENEKVVLCDLDGTVANFDKAMRLHLEALRGPTEDPILEETMYEDTPHIKARRNLIKRLPGFWAELEPITLGLQLLELVRGLGFRPMVLTKTPKNNAPAAMEKLQWCQKFLPGVPATITDDKGLVYGKILIDDWPKYILRWLEWRPRGLVVVPAWDYNAELESHPNCFRVKSTEDFPKLQQLIESM